MEMRTHKVTVVTVTSWVTVGKDEWLFSPTIIHEILDAPQDLVKDRDELHRVSRWADTIVVGISISRGGVGHVRLVVCRIEILAIPARREEDLNTQTLVTAIGRDESGLLVDTGVGGVNAAEVNGLRFESVLCFTIHGIASNHAKALGESLDCTRSGGFQGTFAALFSIPTRISSGS
jgi:hypothetical protein